MLKEKIGTIYSFDIFDTLVTRRVATPAGIFAIMQEQLKKEKNIPVFLQQNFFRIRKEAEEFARYSSFQEPHTNEISIDDIYNIIRINYNLTEDITEYIKNLEIETELKNLVAVDKNVELLKKAQEEGARVILISDMYYGAKTLKYILTHVNNVFQDITIYSSSDYKISKSEGGLYEIIKKIEKEYIIWHHFGDNKTADVKRARLHGIIPHYCPAQELTKYEKKLLNDNEDNIKYQNVIGNARISRWNNTGKNPDKFNFGAAFAGPILYNYVDWIINQALRQGFKTLYFVARDGYIPKIIADIIIEKRELNLQTKYIYGSRKAWRVLVEENYEDIIDYVFCEYGNEIDLKTLCWLLGINEPQKVLEIEPSLKKLNKKNRQIFAEKFKSNKTLKEYLLNLNKNSADLLLEYFTQEVDFTEENVAFVDLYGSGRTQDCLVSILNKKYKNKFYFFYLTITALQQTKNSIKMPYFATFKYLTYWIELFCRTPEGQTLGYKRTADKIVPVVEKIESKNILNWGFNEYLSGIEEFVRNIITAEQINNQSFNTIEIYCKYLDYMRNNLDKNTAAIVGDIPYKLVGREKNMSCAAPKYSLIPLLLNFILCRKSYRKNHFREISFARSGVVIRNLRNFLQEYPTLQSWLLDIHIHKKHNTAYVRILGIKISIARFLWRKQKYAV